MESRKSIDNPKADWFHWVDPLPDGSAPTNWLSFFGGRAWTWEPRRQQYYLHNFLPSQPNLNYANNFVRNALLDVVRFWFDRGVDGVSCEIGDMLLESELQNAVVFSSYSLLASCASALLQFNTPAINATKRLATNVARLVDSRQERKLLAPALLSLFPYCNFHGY